MSTPAKENIAGLPVAQRESVEVAFASRQPPLTLLHDSRNGYETAISKSLLIHPLDAARVVADGGHHAGPHPATHWDEFAPNELYDGLEGGRLSLAQELISEAVEDGRLRCAVVQMSDDPKDELLSHRLFVIDAEVIKNSELTWLGSPFLWVEPSGKDRWGTDDFLFFWDDLVKLRPCLASDLTGNYQVEPGERPTRRSLQQPDKVTKTHIHAAPAAALALYMSTLGEAELARTNQVFATRLVREYEQRNATPPSGDTLNRMVGHIRTVVVESRTGN